VIQVFQPNRPLTPIKKMADTGNQQQLRKRVKLDVDDSSTIAARAAL
jgi:hypothetical protein